MHVCNLYRRKMCIRLVLEVAHQPPPGFTILRHPTTFGNLSFKLAPSVGPDYPP